MNAWTRRALFVLIAVCAVLSGLLGAGCYLVWQHYEGAMQTMEPRIERIQGIVNAQGQIESALKNADDTLAPWLHIGGGDAQNRVQQQLRQLIDSSGTTSVASQAALEAGDGEKVARVRLTATVVGEWASVVKLLESLQAQKPLFWVRSATLMRENGGPTSEPQTARLTIQLEAPLASGGVVQ